MGGAPIGCWLLPLGSSGRLLERRLWFKHTRSEVNHLCLAPISYQHRSAPILLTDLGTESARPKRARGVVGCRLGKVCRGLSPWPVVRC